MALIVNNNPASISAQRNLTTSTNQLGRSVERLSSGLRITRAADDAAGLGLSETLRAHIRSINQAVRNSSDGISLTQIADGAAATMEVRADVIAAADTRAHLIGIEHGDIRAFRRPFLGAPAHLSHSLRAGSTLNPAHAGGIAVDAVALDKIEHEIGGAADGLGQPAAEILAVLGTHL